MILWRVFILFWLSLFLVAQESDASVVEFFRRLGQADHSKTNLDQVSPHSAPNSAPIAAPKLNLSSSQASADPPKRPKVAEETCDHECRDDTNHMTACLSAVVDGNGSPGSVLLVRNDGESYLKLTVTLLPANYTYGNLEIPSHQVKKINISSNTGVNSAIIIRAATGECVIGLGALAPLEKLYQGYATPMNAAYLLFGTAVLIGGTFACCKLSRKGRHLDGVPYQELEMGQQQQPLPYAETADNWDENWDDDWDEEIAVKSPGGSHLRSRQANGAS